MNCNNFKLTMDFHYRFKQYILFSVKQFSHYSVSVWAVIACNMSVFGSTIAGLNAICSTEKGCLLIKTLNLATIVSPKPNY